MITAHPGEGRDPDPKAGWLIGLALSLWTPHLSHPIWVPAFAGMSGIKSTHLVVEAHEHRGLIDGLAL